MHLLSSLVIYAIYLHENSHKLFRSQKNYAEREKIYKMDPLEKPPFNYAQIIAMAMMDQGRMTLKDICKWIQEHFAYFRYNKNWNVSINIFIQHNQKSINLLLFYSTI